MLPTREISRRASLHNHHVIKWLSSNKSLLKEERPYSSYSITFVYSTVFRSMNLHPSPFPYFFLSRWMRGASLQGGELESGLLKHTMAMCHRSAHYQRRPSPLHESSCSWKGGSRMAERYIDHPPRVGVALDEHGRGLGDQGCFIVKALKLLWRHFNHISCRCHGLWLCNPTSGANRKTWSPILSVTKISSLEPLPVDLGALTSSSLL